MNYSRLLRQYFLLNRKINFLYESKMTFVEYSTKALGTSVAIINAMGADLKEIEEALYQLTDHLMTFDDDVSSETSSGIERWTDEAVDNILKELRSQNES